jgi:toxin ParE1/3/4
LTARSEIELTKTAEEDIAAVLDFSSEQFGTRARLRYEVLVAAALEDLRSDPLRPTSQDRQAMHPGIRSYHLRHCRGRAVSEYGEVRAPRHLLLYDMPARGLVTILRLLNDAMELDRHLPSNDDVET